MRTPTTLLVLFTVSISACTLFQAEADPRWTGYRDWTSVVRGLHGDQHGELGGAHEGADGYRNVWVNDTGRTMLLGDGPYVYPVGTVIVKEQFGSEAAWRADSDPDLTVMLKVAEGEGEGTWHWAVGRGGAGPNGFCTRCHDHVEEHDFVFTNGAFLDDDSGR